MRLPPLYTLVTLGILNHTVLGGTRVIVSLYALHLGASPFTVGVLVALYSFLPMLFSVSIGRLVDRVGVRGPMLVGSVLLAVCSALPYLWPTLPMLHVASALIGSSFVLFHVCMQHIVGYMGTPADRSVNFSISSLGYSISGFAGPLLAGFSIDHVGHRYAFLILCFLPLVPAAVLALDWLRLPHTPGHGAAPDPGRRVIDLLRHTDLRRVFLIGSLFAMAWDLFHFAMPIYGASLQLSASSIGIILGSFSFATFLVRLFMPMLARRMPPWPLLAFSLINTALMYLLLPLFESAALLTAVGFAMGLGMGVSQPMVMSLLHSAAPPGRVGEAVGVRMTLVNSSATAIPLVFGAMGLALGLGPVFWATAVVVGAGGWIAKRHAGRLVRTGPRR